MCLCTSAYIDTLFVCTCASACGRTLVVQARDRWMCIPMYMNVCMCMHMYIDTCTGADLEPTSACVCVCVSVRTRSGSGASPGDHRMCSTWCT